MNKVLITADVHPILAEKLETFGYKCEIFKSITYQEVSDIIHNYEGLIIRSLTVDRALIDKAVNLKFVGRAGSGLEAVDQVYAREKNIGVFNSPEGNRSAVAEHTIAMILNLLHKINSGFEEVKKMKWDRNGNSGVELSALTVGIIGFGNVGYSLAEKLKSFGCRIIAYDKYKFGFGDNAHVEEVSLSEIQSQADVVSIHLPSNSETKNLVSKLFLNKLQKSPILVNTSRGDLIDFQSIVDSIDKNQISGLALDVFPKEPLKLMSESDKLVFNLLIQRPNVLLTPHSAGLTRQSYVKLANVLAEKILNFLKFHTSLLILCFLN